MENSVESVDIHIDGKSIRAIEPRIDVSAIPSDTRIVDAEGCYVFPGFIDAHTHYGLGEGEEATADDFFTGSRAAAYGGITTIIDFADQLPGESLLAGAKLRIRQASESVIDYALHQGVYQFHRGMGEELDEMRAQGISAIKIFSTYRQFGCYLDPTCRPELFQLCRDRKTLITMHAEDDKLMEKIHADYPKTGLSPRYHALLRPDTAEYQAMSQAGEVALNVGTPLYFVHVSSALGLKAIRALRQKGATVYAETAPHYLFLDKTFLEGDEGALFTMTPPLRTKEDNRALLDAIAGNEIGIVATDHCSYMRWQKMQPEDCRDIPSGIPGSEHMASLVYTRCVARGGMDVVQMKNLLSEQPAKVFGMFPRKGCLKVGSDADLVIFSPKILKTITAAESQSHADYTPYEGFSICGAPILTICGGHIVMDNGRFCGHRGAGSFVMCGTSSLYPDA